MKVTRKEKYITTDREKIHINTVNERNNKWIRSLSFDIVNFFSINIR